MVFGLKKMDEMYIDATNNGMERGNVSVILSPDDKAQKSLDELTEGDDRLALALKGASVERLKVALATQLELLNINSVLRVSSELTARGIAPCFRYLQHQAKHDGFPTLTARQRLEIESEGSIVIYDNEQDQNELELDAEKRQTEFILLCADLQWIVATYPDHVPEWQRAKQIFDPRRFRVAATYLSWGGKRTSGQIAKALALTEQQQLECVWIQCLHVQRWRERLFRRLPIAMARITSDIRDKDKRQVKEQDVTILHRCNLWLCAELAKWKPQLTANFYAMLSGQTLSRQAVANQLAKLPRVRRADEVIAY